MLRSIILAALFLLPQVAKADDNAKFNELYGMMGKLYWVSDQEIQEKKALKEAAAKTLAQEAEKLQEAIRRRQEAQQNPPERVESPEIQGLERTYKVKGMNAALDAHYRARDKQPPLTAREEGCVAEIYEELNRRAVHDGIPASAPRKPIARPDLCQENQSRALYRNVR